MKLYLILISILISPILKGQTYSSEITDTAITTFMTWFFKSDTSKSNKYVAKRIQTLMPYNFEYKTTTKYSYPFGNIFAHNKSLFKIFTKKDADFFVKQIEKQEGYYWNFKIKGVQLFDAEANVAPKNRTVYFYSLPLFSSDKSIVMISTGFVRGEKFAGGVYYLFKKRKGSGWTKIKEFQKWGD
jgi:hypothetical protein